MKRIWKFSTPDPNTEGPLHLMLPIGSKVVWLDQGQMWIEGDFPFSELDTRGAIFTVFGTNHPIGDHLRHVGSYQEGPYIWHVYVYAGDWLKIK